MDIDLSQAKPIGPLRGVYLLLRGGKVCYVGMTINIYARLSDHIRFKSPEAYCFIPYGDDTSDAELFRIERELIQRFRPEQNVQGIARPYGRTIGTQRALERVQAGEIPYQAAKKEHIALSTIYRALRTPRTKSYIKPDYHAGAKESTAVLLALDRVAAGQSIPIAAKTEGVAISSVRRAIKRRAEGGVDWISPRKPE